MKLGIFILIFSFLNPILTHTEHFGTIHVKVDGIKNENGTLRVDLFSEHDEFLIEPSYSMDVKIDTQSEIIIRFDNIPFGIYALSLYHDLNDDNRLEANFIRMPQEPVGFSNDHQPKMGPPRFKKAKFTLDQKEISMTISMYSY